MSKSQVFLYPDLTNLAPENWMWKLAAEDFIESNVTADVTCQILLTISPKTVRVKVTKEDLSLGQIIILPNLSSPHISHLPEKVIFDPRFGTYQITWKYTRSQCELKSTQSPNAIIYLEQKMAYKLRKDFEIVNICTVLEF